MDKLGLAILEIVKSNFFLVIVCALAITSFINFIPILEDYRDWKIFAFLISIVIFTVYVLSEFVKNAKFIKDIKCLRQLTSLKDSERKLLHKLFFKKNVSGKEYTGIFSSDNSLDDDKINTSEKLTIERLRIKKIIVGESSITLNQCLCFWLNERIENRKIQFKPFSNGVTFKILYCQVISGQCFTKIANH